MSHANRYARHLVLKEIGSEGQARLEDLTLAVPSGRAGAVAGDYLRRAGVRIADGSSVIPISMAHGVPETRIAVDTVRGALAALEVIRRGVGLSPAPPLEIQP